MSGAMRNEDDKVVLLASAMARTRYPVVGQLRDYWNGLRGARPLPCRAEINPREIEAALEFAFILERTAQTEARFRLAGMHLNELMGMEVRGMPLSSVLDPGARDELAQVLDQLFDTPVTVSLMLVAAPEADRPAMMGQMLLMPLRNDRGEITRALGCLATAGTPGRLPRRFSIAEAQVNRIEMPEHESLPLRGPWPPMAPGGPRGRGQFALPQQIDPTRYAEGAVRPWCHLTLVSSRP